MQPWADGTHSNRGFHIRYVSGGSGQIDYATKEATDNAHHPQLIVTTQNSGKFIFSSIGDTELTSSSRTVTQGQKADMRVRNQLQVLLVWYDLTALDGKIITNAQLKLTTTKQFNNRDDSVHGIFATQTENWDTLLAIEGITGSYPNDVGLSNHPDIYLSYAFGLYYGGAGNTPHDQHIAIDNVVISKSYIGPMKKE